MSKHRAGAALLAVVTSLFAAGVDVPAGHTLARVEARSGCGRYAGEAYIRCVESAGNQPRYLRDRAPHPGPSSASGPYGLLDGTRRDYRCGHVSDRECATRYMKSRYGSWAAAARAHRRKGWW